MHAKTDTLDSLLAKLIAAARKYSLLWKTEKNVFFDLDSKPSAKVQLVETILNGKCKDWVCSIIKKND
jgi:hypothetical protein